MKLKGFGPPGGLGEGRHCQLYILKAFILGMKVSRKKLDANGLVVSGLSRISQQSEASPEGG